MSFPLSHTIQSKLWVLDHANSHSYPLMLQPYWQPHNRSVARRIQNMGWRADGGLWLLVRGGGLYLSKGTGASERSFLLNFYSSIIHLDSNILNSSAMTINSFGVCFHWLLADCILNNSLKNTTRPDICNCETMTLWNWASNKEAPVVVTVSPFVPVNCHSPLWLAVCNCQWYSP